MFKNKSVHVKLVKDIPAEQSNPTRDLPLYAHYAKETGTDAVKGAVILLGAYIAFDTIRQVTVKIVESKL